MTRGEIGVMATRHDNVIPRFVRGTSASTSASTMPRQVPRTSRGMTVDEIVPMTVDEIVPMTLDEIVPMTVGEIVPRS